MTVLRRLLAVLLMTAGCGVADAAQTASPPQGPLGEREVTVVNRSGRAIHEVYVSPTAADTWGDDRLTHGVLAPSASLRIKLGRMRDCSFDIQVVYDNDAREVLEIFNACRSRQAVFDGSKAMAPPAQETEHRVVLQNNSRLPIQQVFVSPADSQQWGEDLLADGDLAAGNSAAVTYRGACVADFRIVFDNLAAEERRGLDLCHVAALRIAPGWTTADQGTLFSPASMPASAPGQLTIENRSGATIVEFYLRPEPAASPYADLLGGKVIADGGREVVIDVARPSCRYEARIVHDGARPDQVLTGLDVCKQPVLTVQP